MADLHRIRNLSKTIRSGRGNSIYAPPSPACRHMRFMLLPECKCSSSFCNSKNVWGGLDKTSDALRDCQEAWLCRTAVCDMNSLSERERKRSVAGIVLLILHRFMLKRIEVCHWLVPLPRTQLKASSSASIFEKPQKMTGNDGIFTYIFTDGLFARD